MNIWDRFRWAIAKRIAPKPTVVVISKRPKVSPPNIRRPWHGEGSLTRQQIIDTLRVATKPLSAADIAGRTGATTVRMLLPRLVESGVIHITTQGKRPYEYELAPSPYGEPSTADDAVDVSVLTDTVSK